VIVGGGPTGVELSGALCEIARHTLARDFRRINPAQAHVILLEGSARVLPTYVPDLSEAARKQLVRLGVDVRTGQRVTAVDAGGVALGDGRIAARTVLWAAGVAGSGFGRALGLPLDATGRVSVEADLSLPGHEDVFLVGDLAAIAQDGQLVAGVAPAAIQAARHAARNILRSMRGAPRLPFRYKDKGSLATIGRSAAVADLHFVKLSGLLAWVAWLALHLMALVGFRNRVFVFLEWAWSFLSYDRGARLITGPLRGDPKQARAERAPK
jgi:NADH dehydrogenase